MAAEGLVYQLNVKPAVAGEHGLPKIKVDSAEVTIAGMDGDFNRYRHESKADDERMALLLMPIETIEQLNAEGWPVKVGDLGENITTKGIGYALFGKAGSDGKIVEGSGARLRIGETLEIEVAKVCTPCSNLYSLPYVGVANGPRFLKETLGRRGWYARVLKGGTIKQGDRITLL